MSAGPRQTNKILLVPFVTLNRALVTTLPESQPKGMQFPTRMVSTGIRGLDSIGATRCDALI